MSYAWDSLITKASFPFSVKELKVLQTHISYVFLADEVVYKIKKPVNFGFLDFSTLEKRKFYCEREVVLNRRLCPEVYLGVVGVVEREGQFFLEGEGKVLDYAVKMKRLPEEGMMTRLLTEGTLTSKHIDLLIEKLVPFYQKADTNEEISQYGSLEVISFNVEENFTQTERFVGKALSSRKYDHIVNYSRSFMKENKSLFEARCSGGFIKDGHGDLYSANICFDDLKEVYVFDCIEFNERFRCGDVCSDLAFLAMDLDFHRKDDLSTYFITEYVKKSGDRDLLSLLNFYKCYRAYVRGKIGCFTWEDERVEEGLRNQALASAQRYFDLAFHYTGGLPKVIVFMGLSCTGKTYFAERLKQEYPLVYLSSDVERKRLLELNPEEHYYAEFEKGIYSPEISDRVYQGLAERTLEEVRYGRDVLLDATFRKRKWREMLLKKLEQVKCEILFVWFTAKDEVIQRRFAKRAQQKTVSDALYTTYLEQKKNFDEPTEVKSLFILDTSEESKELFLRLKDYLQI